MYLQAVKYLAEPSRATILYLAVNSYRKTIPSLNVLHTGTVPIQDTARSVKKRFQIKRNKNRCLVATKFRVSSFCGDSEHCLSALTYSATADVTPSLSSDLEPSVPYPAPAHPPTSAFTICHRTDIEILLNLELDRLKLCSTFNLVQS